jgi:hypothetical protein
MCVYMGRDIVSIRSVAFFIKERPSPRQFCARMDCRPVRYVANESILSTGYNPAAAAARFFHRPSRAFFL